MEHWKVLSATMVGREEKFSNSRRSRMAKTIIFRPWWQPFNSFCFETLSFLPLSPFLLFATQKSGEAMAPLQSPPPPPGVAGPVNLVKETKLEKINVKRLLRSLLVLWSHGSTMLFKRMNKQINSYFTYGFNLMVLHKSANNFISVNFLNWKMKLPSLETLYGLSQKSSGVCHVWYEKLFFNTGQIKKLKSQNHKMFLDNHIVIDGQYCWLFCD